jgi:hypothetical protein
MQELQRKIDCAVTRNMSVSEFCQPIQLGAGEDAFPQITFFPVPIELIQILPDLTKIKESLIFNANWKMYSKTLLKKIAGKDKNYDNQVFAEENEDIEFNGDGIRLQDVVEYIWEPAYERTKHLLQKLRDGVITFQEVDSEFSGSSEDIKQEIVLLCNVYEVKERKFIDSRIKQIEEYHKLKSYKAGAEVMAEIKNDFGLEGDFKMLDLFIRAVSFSFCLIY